MKIKKERDIVLAARDLLDKHCTPFTCVPECRKCCGPVPFSRWEGMQVNRPDMMDGAFSKHREDGSCVFAGYHGCSVYKHRPILCRLFGHVSNMACPMVPSVPQISVELEHGVVEAYFSLFPESVMTHPTWKTLALYERKMGIRKEFCTSDPRIAEIAGIAEVPEHLRTLGREGSVS